MQQPRPHLVRVTSIDGSMHEVACGQTPWTRVVETLAALQPELLQAMTADGKLLRAIRPADHSEDWTAESGDPKPSGARVEHIPIVAADPETQRFALVAQLLANAYKHANEIAFNRLVQLVDSQNQRSNDVEKARETLYKAHVKQLEDQIRAAGQEPQGEGELLGAMLSQFMGGMQMQQPPPPPPPPPPTPNGKH